MTGALDLAGVLGLAGVLVLAADLAGAFREGDFLRPAVLTLDWAFGLIFLGDVAFAFTDLVFFLATMRAPSVRTVENQVAWRRTTPIKVNGQAGTADRNIPD
jgi:hypothetical protein